MTSILNLLILRNMEVMVKNYKLSTLRVATITQLDLMYGYFLL